MMKKSGRILLSLILVLVCAGLASCGGGSNSAGNSAGGGGSSSTGSAAGTDVVARVGSTPITRAAVSHWMRALAGHDYFELSGRHKLPEGLVSDPPNYAGCVARMEALVATSPSKRPLPTGVKLLTKCRQLYEALRAQATNFLVNTQWLINTYRDYGVTATEAEAVQFAKQEKARGFPVSEAEYPKYLAQTLFTPADQLLRLKLDLLAQKGLKKFTAGGGQGYAAFLKLGQKWTARTICSSGYVVERCSEYKPGSSLYSSSGLPASVLIEQVASIVTGRCTNLAACGKQ